MPKDMAEAVEFTKLRDRSEGQKGRTYSRESKCSSGQKALMVIPPLVKVIFESCTNSFHAFLDDVVEAVEFESTGLEVASTRIVKVLLRAPRRFRANGGLGTQFRIQDLEW
jgi:hypothetical protein